MRWLVTLAGLSLLHLGRVASASPEHAAAEAVARFAVVIGKNEPEDPGQATLRYADDDAMAMHELLQEAEVQSVLLVAPDGDTLALRGPTPAYKPTLAAVLAAFAEHARAMQAAKQAGKRTELTLFYSGHGDVADGEGFVVLEGGHLTRSLLLEQIIAASPADANHVIIDACKSYFMVFDKGPGGERRPFHQAFADSGSGKNLDRTGFVLSSSSHEESHEWERYQAGVFSYEVRSGLRGAADADLDGRITYGELGAFVSTANRGIVNPKLRPDFVVSPPGNSPANLTLPLLRWNQAAASLTVDAPASDHYYVETKSGIRIADVHPKRAEQLDVHLPAARPLFVRRADDTSEAVLEAQESTRLSALAMGPSTVARKGALSIAFESLFSTPFSVEVVKAYDTLYTSKAVALSAPAQEPPRTERARQIVLGVGAAGLVLGGVMTGLALSARDDARAATQVEIPSMNRKIDRYNTVAIVGYGIAAASGVSWLALKLWSRKPGRPRTAVLPILSPAELAVGLAGTWGD